MRMGCSQPHESRQGSFVLSAACLLPPHGDDPPTQVIHPSVLQWATIHRLALSMAAPRLAMFLSVAGD
jgi:hypothetical protein